MVVYESFIHLSPVGLFCECCGCQCFDLELCKHLLGRRSVWAFSMAVQHPPKLSVERNGLKTLSDEDKKLLHVEDSNSVFKFGDSKWIKSNKKVRIPTVITDQKVMLTQLTTYVISNDLSLFLSKEPMKKANTQIDFASDKINILNRDVQVIFSTSGHDCTPACAGRQNTTAMHPSKEVK